MGFFEGFLSGFSQVGSELIQQEDTRKQRANEIVQQADEQIRINNARIDKEAKAQLEARKELLQQQKELLYGVNPLQATVPSEPVMPMEPEIDLETGQPVTSTFTGITQPTTNSIPREYLEPYLGDEDMLQKGMRDYKADMKLQQDMSVREERDIRAEEARNARFDKMVQEDKEKEVRVAWREAETNKNHPLYPILNTAAKAKSILSIVREAKAANNRRNISSTAESLLSRAQLVTISEDAKAIQKAGGEEVKAMTDAWGGNISNFEAEYFQSLAVNPDNKWAVNNTRLIMLEVSAARAEQFAKFVSEVKKKDIDPQEAAVRWREYLNSQDKLNPTIVPDDRRKTLTQLRTYEDIVKDKSWREYLKGDIYSIIDKTASSLPDTSSTPAPKTVTGTESSAKTNISSEGNTSGYKSFDDLYKDVQGE